MPCTSLKADTVICNKATPEGQTLCGIHEKVRRNKGPNAFAMDQLKLKQKAEKRIEYERLGVIMDRIRDMPADDPVRNELLNQYVRESGEFNRRQSQERAALARHQRAEIARNGGVNPDQPQINRRLVDRQIKEWQGMRRSIMRFPRHDWTAHVNDYRIRIHGYIETGHFGDEGTARLIQHLQLVETESRQLLIANRPAPLLLRVEEARQREAVAQERAAAAAEVARRAEAVRDALMGRMNRDELDWGGIGRAFQVVNANPNENLAAFVRDKQNVHTQRTVEQTKQNIEIIRQIFVPEKYRWNLTKTSQTFREIVYECDLTPKANWQFAAAYCSDATIYEMEKGIYGIVTDGVWQFIRDSPDKACLLKILKTEMEDNIGMCAQGNLSRICNVLSGYLEGIGNKESLAEILGREFPKLMEIDNEKDRVLNGTEILRNHNVPEGEWEAWLEPLRA